MRRSLALLAGLATVVLLASACGNGSESGTGSGGGGGDGGGGGSALELPSVELRDVATGDSVNLSSLLPAQQPLLVWAWAPH